MDRSSWHQLLNILKQKSTIAGIVSLVGTIYAIWGSELTPEQVASVTGALAALLSVVAIIIQPRPKGGHFKPGDYKAGDSYEEPGQPMRVFDGEKWG